MTYNLIVLGLGAGAGLAELLARYRSDPGQLLRTTGAWLYVAINALAAVGALGVIRVLGLTFGARSPGVQHLLQVIIAGLGALAFFRSSISILRIGNRDVGIELAAIVNTMLEAVDKSVDRSQAKRRSKVVREAMDGISFARAYVGLPTYCLGLLQNASPEDQVALSKQVAELVRRKDMSEHHKVLALGVAVLNVVGPQILREGIAALGESIRSVGVTEVIVGEVESEAVSSTLLVEAGVHEGSADEMIIELARLVNLGSIGRFVELFDANARVNYFGERIIGHDGIRSWGASLISREASIVPRSVAAEGERVTWSHFHFASDLDVLKGTGEAAIRNGKITQLTVLGHEAGQIS
jgi:hypothetical protein